MTSSNLISIIDISRAKKEILKMTELILRNKIATVASYLESFQYDSEKAKTTAENIVSEMIKKHGKAAPIISLSFDYIHGTHSQN